MALKVWKELARKRGRHIDRKRERELVIKIAREPDSKRQRIKHKDSKC